MLCNRFGHAPEVTGWIWRRHIRGEGKVTVTGIIRHSNPRPATAIQQGLLYESVLANRPWANLEQVVLDGRGPMFGSEAMRLAWTALANRHDALRMVLRADGQGGFVQDVLPHHVPAIAEHDLTALAPEAQETAVEAFLAKDREACVEPLVRPGWRISVLRLTADRAVMVWTIHHALIDGASMAIVLEELGLLLAKKPLPAPAPQGFSAYSQLVRQTDKTAARAFFAGMFADGPVPGNLASSGPPGRMASLSGALSSADSDALCDRARAAGATTLNAVQAAWALVLARWTGQAEACFGLVDSGRQTFTGFERTVGCLISTLPMRIRLDADQSLAAFLASLRQETLALRDHSHVSLTEVRQWSGLSGQSSLFETIVMFDRATLARRMRVEGGPLATCPLRLLEEGTAAATLAVANDPQLQLQLEYDPTRLDKTIAEAVFRHVERLLVSIARSGPQTSLAELSMLSADETDALLRLGSPDVALPDEPPCIATRFERAARHDPDRPAVIEVATGETMSFRDIDQAANALAHVLSAQGLRSGDVVALHLPRSAAYVTALLAVLKLGAAFLPLDRDLPPEWLADLAFRAGAKALVGAEIAGLEVAVTLRPDLSDRRSDPPLRPLPDESRVAYVLYTSGSTGMPKAVQGLCGALSAHASAVIQTFGLEPRDRVLQFAGLGFDVSLEEIVPTLLVGATVVLRDAESAGAVRGLMDLLTRQAITVANLPASFWHIWVDELDASKATLPPDLRLVVTGSEPVNPQTLRRWRALAPRVTWINGYGPTETTITCTALVLRPDTPLTEPLRRVPIGRPLPHARVRVRAFDGSLTPKGGVGTLWIAGPAVTGGYLGAAGKNEAFQIDPWQKGQRIYCTGDLVRWQPDGQLAFLGRRDRQIKIRGHRIDLNQIETLIAGLDGIRQTHVDVVRVDRTEADSGAARLVAWVVPHRTLVSGDVKNLLQRHLPQAMLPHIVVLDALPVAPNGKIDRRALPAPGFDSADLEQLMEHEAAQGPLVRAIAACMAEVLGRDRVPANVGFSDLGGDSLLALRLVSLIEKHTGHVLQTANLHQHDSAEALARLLQSGTTAPRYTIPIQPKGNKPPFFAIHVLGRNEDLFRPLSDALGPDQPMFGLSVGIPRNLDDINVERTARIYFDEIQTYHPKGPIGLGAVSMAAYFAYELAQLLRAAGREVRVLAVLDAMGPDGRPALTGWAKARAHLQQVRLHGAGHFLRVLKNRIDRRRERREALQSAPDQVNAVNLIAANVCAVEFYQPKPYDGPLTVFRADHSFWDSPEALASGLGWASVARGGLEMHDLPGTHLSILHPGNVDVLAAHIRRLMADPSSPQTER